MIRLRVYILIFFITISIPLGFVIWQSYSGLEQEERAQLRFFSETLFDQMERELAELVQTEENRAVDEYQHYLAASTEKGRNKSQLSPLTEALSPGYILGYLQNNPDGSFQTPLIADLGAVPLENRALVAQLKEANRIFNRKKFSIAQQTPQPTALSEPLDKSKERDSFSERYLSRSKSAPTKSYLGKKKQRIEQVTAEQVYNIASDDESLREGRQRRQDSQKMQAPASVSVQGVESATEEKREGSVASGSSVEEQEILSADQFGKNDEQFQVEVAPFQSVSIQQDQVYIFRRIAVNNQIYRQGFIVLVTPLLNHLISTHFSDQPLASFTSLQMQRRDQGSKADYIRAGVSVTSTDFLAERVFPSPFDFLGVSLTANGIPSSPARSTLNVALAILGLFMILGLLAIYQSARTIVLMSERRSQFVSSVTHELKTPLTNIRMYIEMLEQGVAATPEREQEYLSILGSESTRLSGLINNVLDLAKLEKKQRHFHMEEGRLEDVLKEVETIMSQKLKQDGFLLKINASDVPLFEYDRDVLIQILMNLIENSVKFGKHSPKREITIEVSSTADEIQIALSDSGPGIPKRALKKVFDEFYRVDNDLTRTTGGTGIGLTLVKKFIEAMGGRVQAANNIQAGCTITLFFPKKHSN